MIQILGEGANFLLRWSFIGQVLLTYPFQRSVWDALCSRTKKNGVTLFIFREENVGVMNKQRSKYELYNKHHYEVFAYSIINIFWRRGVELNKVENTGLYKMKQKTITHSCSLFKYSALLLYTYYLLLLLLPSSSSLLSSPLLLLAIIITILLSTSSSLLSSLLQSYYYYYLLYYYNKLDMIEVWQPSSFTIVLSTKPALP